jgi:5-methylcytosine-specific restriction endonuclease McrA
MQQVFVLDRDRQPLMPCHPARARAFLKAGRAAVYRRQPFTIILNDRAGGETQPVALKIDPGSRVTGLALVADAERGKRTVWGADLAHRGLAIRDAFVQRRAARHSRRARKTRYRAARFRNRRVPKGWLPPSQRSRIDNVLVWAERLSRLCPVSNLSLELARFDTQRMQNPDITDAEYERGTLWGYELGEYLLEKWGRKCAYCGAEGVPLQKEHIVPRARGGSNRVSNLTLACAPCNQQKGSRTAAEFGYPQIQAEARKPLADAAAVTAIRWALYWRLRALDLPLETGSGGQTKYNRVRRGLPKAHWLDAVCVGESGAAGYIAPGYRPLVIRATGRGRRQMCLMDKYGFPRTKARQRHKRVRGFQTGDLARAVVPKYRTAGTHVGRVAVRSNGSFRVGAVDNISWRYCALLQRVDGYEYAYGETPQQMIDNGSAQKT